MSAGIAVLASDFPLYRTLIEKYDCGCFVDPLDIQKTALSIQSMLDQKEQTRRQGQNGYKAVITEYNWEKEKKKLISFYNKTLSIKQKN